MFNTIQHFKNIKKIYSLNFNLIFIIKYLTGLLQKKFINLKNISQISEFKRIYTEGSYSFNWTAGNSHNFLIIAQVKKKMERNGQQTTVQERFAGVENLSILEIGSFEGYSANIFNKIFVSPEIFCVDPWVAYSLHPNLNFTQIENNFDKNTKKLNIKKFKMRSSDFFKNNNKKFDLIYIDGSHKADDVLADAIESYKILKSGGILFFDDFLGMKKFDNNDAIDGIAFFLKKINYSNLKLIFINSQIGFLKL
jgi:hypothetical protein